MHPDTIISNPGLVHRNCLKAGRVPSSLTPPWHLLYSWLPAYSTLGLHTHHLAALFICYVLCKYTQTISTFPSTVFEMTLLFLWWVSACAQSWAHQTLPSAHSLPSPTRNKFYSFSELIPSSSQEKEHFFADTCAQCSCPQFVPQSFKFLGMLYSILKFQSVI